MKEATGELNMTLVTVIAVAAILAFVTLFVPDILNSIKSKWNQDQDIDVQNAYVMVETIR